MPRHLEAYRRKRRAERTREPFGGSKAANLYRFVVQQHAARRLHYDFRLEWQGVLKSWAVPRGPSRNPQDKRMAVFVEDHPVDYAGFEGVIPPGNYGAGNVIVWDQGVWTPLEDPAEGLEKGKLLFELHGYKLRGVWTLVRTKAEWLLIKKPDAYADSAAPWDETSVLSGLTVAARGQAVDAAPWHAALAAHGLEPQPSPHPPCLPMLASTAPGPFSRAGWLFELKYDGYRLGVEREASQVRLRYRRGADATALYPELAHALGAWPVNQMVLDGELVAHDAAGLPSFQALQGRAVLHSAHEIQAASVRAPVALYVFDLLMLEHIDLRGLPLRQRKALLAQLAPRLGPVRYADHVEEQGEALFAQVQHMQLEGLMAKQATSVYTAGRSQQWLKIPAHLRHVFTVVGYTPPQGTRVGLGALQLAQGTPHKLRYVGAVGTGFDDATLQSLAQALQPDRVSEPPCAAAARAPKDVVWTQPRLRSLIRYKELTGDGLLRQAVFEGLASAHSEVAPAAASAEPAVAVSRSPKESADGFLGSAGAKARVPVSNPGKVFWPEEGFTKGDLLAYYEAISPWLLPYLRDRPVTLTRFPDGIHGKSFFQKDAPEWVPSWVRTVRLWSDTSEREIDYFVCDDLPSLLYVINLGTIALHIGSSRISSLGQPDWCVVDLDPKEAPFVHVVRVARALHRICTQIGLPSFVKTTGSSGLHVMLPLHGALTHAQCRSFAELLGRVVVQAEPHIATVARPLHAREGKVYVDTGQNGHGRLLVAPFSVRPVPQARVSTPLGWREVTERLDHHRFTMRSVPARFKKLRGGDPLIKVMTTRVNLLRALDRLEALLGD